MLLPQLFACAPDGAGNGAEAPAVGDLAPDFTLYDADGGAFTLSEHADEAVLVDFAPRSTPRILPTGSTTST